MEKCEEGYVGMMVKGGELIENISSGSSNSSDSFSSLREKIVRDKERIKGLEKTIEVCRELLVKKMTEGDERKRIYYDKKDDYASVLVQGFRFSPDNKVLVVEDVRLKAYWAYPEDILTEEELQNEKK